MTHLYLIRHGDYLEDLENGSYQDQGLSETGIRQIECLRDRLVSTGEIQADVLIASTMLRAKATAEILAPGLGAPIVFEKDIAEWVCDDGTLSPEAFSARWNQVPDAHKPFFRFMAGYETGLEFSGRVQAVLHRLLQEYSGKTLVLVTHGGVIAVAFHYFFGISGAVPARVIPSAKQASITHLFLTPEGGTWVLERFNDAHHVERVRHPSPPEH